MNILHFYIGSNAILFFWMIFIILIGYLINCERVSLFILVVSFIINSVFSYFIIKNQTKR